VALLPAWSTPERFLTGADYPGGTSGTSCWGACWIWRASPTIHFRGRGRLQAVQEKNKKVSMDMCQTVEAEVQNFPAPGGCSPWR
jgi:hypothetical protein